MVLTNPHGLGKDGDLLFICDGSAGLKVYDASDPKEITSHLIYSYPNIKAYDVIPVGNLLVLIGDDGFISTTIPMLKNITLLSSILIVTRILSVRIDGSVSIVSEVFNWTCTFKYLGRFR